MRCVVPTICWKSAPAVDAGLQNVSAFLTNSGASSASWQPVCRAVRVDKTEGRVKADLFNQLHRGGEICLRFSREADDEVRGRNVGSDSAPVLDRGFIFEGGVTTPLP